MDARTFGFELPAEMTSENRGKDRVSVALTARLRDRASNKYDVHVLDMSVTGFRAEAHHGLDQGMIVWLTIPGMQGLEATVAWRRGKIIGCRFAQPLYPAVLDHLVKTLSR
jgi:hypothetical protein